MISITKTKFLLSSNPSLVETKKFSCLADKALTFDYPENNEDLTKSTPVLNDGSFQGTKFFPNKSPLDGNQYFPIQNLKVTLTKVRSHLPVPVGVQSVESELLE